MARPTPFSSGEFNGSSNNIDENSNDVPDGLSAGIICNMINIFIQVYSFVQKILISLTSLTKKKKVPLLGFGTGKLDRSVADRWEVTPKCFTGKENKERRGILPAAKERPKAKYYYIVI